MYMEQAENEEVKKFWEDRIARKYPKPKKEVKKVVKKVVKE